MTEKTAHHSHSHHAPHDEASSPGDRRHSAPWPRVQVFLLSRWILLGSFILVSFFAAVVGTLRRDGLETLRAQQDALVLEVFSRTGLKRESQDLLQEKLRTLGGVVDLEAQSPEESLSKLGTEGKIDIDANWLAQKNSDLKGGGVLPWSYSLHLARWDEAFLKDLTEEIERIELGYPKEAVVSEVHYDKERWALVYALQQYVQWLGKVLLVCALIVGSFAVNFIFKLFQSSRRKKFPFGLKDWAVIFGLGCVCGFLSHLVYLLALSLSFFPESFSWKVRFGSFLAQQVLLCVLLVAFSYGYRASERARES
jgi:hypothetical protein